MDDTLETFAAAIDRIDRSTRDSLAAHLGVTNFAIRFRAEPAACVEMDGSRMPVRLDGRRGTVAIDNPAGAPVAADNDTAIESCLFGGRFVRE